MKLKRSAMAILIAFIAVSSGVGANGQALSPELSRFADLIVERLALMEGVAAYKFSEDRPVEDLAREASVIQAGEEQASRLGIPPRTVTPFVQAQMDAAKAVQRHRISAWRDGSATPPASAPDLATELRPAISKVTAALMTALTPASPQLKTEEYRQALVLDLEARLTGSGLDRAKIRAIVEGAALVQLAANAPPDVLEKVRTAGVLRVGTTGDYAPFSHWTGERFEGIDIDLAGLLAADLDVELRFVRTSWPTLMQDLAANRFDVAISGITDTEARAKVAHFSSAYHTGGKAPIARCTDVERYDTLAEIDTEGTRVIVNPGGTNERFTRANVEDAQIIVFEDNTKVFDEIAEGRADVMITDAIEVSLQSARNPALCPTMPDRTLTTSQKALMMPQDDALRAYVNDWLARTKASGILEALFETHLNAATPPPR